MRITQLHIDGASYHLPVNYDSRALQQQLITAASGAPAFVTFHAAGQIEVSVLVTAHTSVRLELSNRSETSIEDDDEVFAIADRYGFVDTE